MSFVAPNPIPQSNEMPDRSDCVRILDRPEKMLFHYGEGFLYESLPAGTRVIYPPEPLPAIEDVEGAIAHALDHPLGCDPLSAQLRPGMKVTIVFDDLSIPLPPMQAPDLRQRVIAQVLDQLAAAGVSDIHLIAAIAVHRRMTPRELRHVLGKKIFNEFCPDRLYNHDAEDKENIVFLGTTGRGEVIEVNRRAVESDLVIYVNINIASQSGGHKAIATGLGSYRSLKNHHNVKTLMNSKSYMDPPNSALHHSCNRMGKIIESNLNIFRIETTVNNNAFPYWLTFLRKRAWDFNGFDKLNLHANRLSLDLLPVSIKREIFNQMYAPYGMTGIYAGKTELVHEKTLENIYRQQAVPVEGQADIVITGIPYVGPYSVNSILNPILFMCTGLGYFFNFYRGKPLIRQGGVYIFTYPLHEQFHPVHHPSYSELYHRILTQTTDSSVIETYEEEFAHNPQYVDQYRNSYAFHGVHALYAWYWGCRGFDHVDKVIVVKPKDKRPAEILGFETADSVEEAIARARDFVGPNASITNYQSPPYLLCDVT